MNWITYVISWKDALMRWTLWGDAMQDYEGHGVGFIAYSMKQLAGRLAKLVEEAEALESKED